MRSPIETLRAYRAMEAEWEEIVAERDAHNLEPTNSQYACHDDDLTMHAHHLAAALEQVLETNQVNITYDLFNAETGIWYSSHHVILPSWCAGDPEAAASLYLFGWVPPRGTVIRNARVTD